MEIINCQISELCESVFDFFNNITDSYQMDVIFLHLLVYYILFQRGIKKKGINNILSDLSDYSKEIQFISKNFKTDINALETSDYFKILTIFNKYSGKDNFILIFIDFLKKNKKQSIKPISEYYPNNDLVTYMNKLAKPKNESILNLHIGYGSFIYDMFKNHSIELEKIYGYENKDTILHAALMNIYSLTGNISKNIKKGDILHENIINEYDLIICDFPTGIRNIIHANCCNKIKKLKIRGTKSEPLILQLIMTSLNKNGRVVINVPNTLLNNDSNQHIETRKYLLNNFNVIKIVDISQDFQFNKDYQSSVIHFVNDGKTKTIEFAKLTYEDGKVTEKTIMNVDYEKIVKKEYNLYYEKYVNENQEFEITNKKMKEIVKVATNDDNIKLLHGHYLKIPLTLENTIVSLEYDNFEFSNDFITLLVQNNEECNQIFFNYYFQQLIAPTITTFTKGKQKKLDIESLLETKIPILSGKTQKTIINYFNLNNELIKKNNQQITLYENLKSEFLNLYVTANTIMIKDICEIENSCLEEDSIMIQKNSSIAGKVSLSSSKCDSKNYYYLHNIKKVNKKYLYYLLKNNEQTLRKLSNLTVTTNLSRNNLENFEIPIVSVEIQDKIITQIELYDNIIKQLIEMNNIILSKYSIKDVIDLEKNK
jgi:hypothetical protein